jgi:hypothetical protein
MRGMPAYDTTQSHWLFILCTYLIMVFGDMPAVSKLMRMKGVNGIFPCRACNIQGICDSSNHLSTAHYTPLHRLDGDSYEALELPLRTHKEFIHQAT